MPYFPKSKVNIKEASTGEFVYKEGRKANAYHIIIKPTARFFIHYIIRLGFLDFYPGYMFAKAQAYGVYAKYIKLWLLNRDLK